MLTNSIQGMLKMVIKNLYEFKNLVVRLLKMDNIVNRYEYNKQNFK